MSVPKSLRSVGKLNVQTKAYDFASYTHHICTNEKVFLKRYRWCSTAKIIEACDSIVFNIDLANSVDIRGKNPIMLNKRLELQQNAIDNSIILESLMEIAYRDNNREGRLIADSKIEFWIKSLLELRTLLRSWKESTLKGSY